MAGFINFEAEAEVVEVEDGKEDDEVSNISEDSFIDDQKVGADVNFYKKFVNVENDLDQVLTEAQNEALKTLNSLMKFQSCVVDLTVKFKLMNFKVLKKT